MEPESASSHSHEPIIGPYHKPDESIHILKVLVLQHLSYYDPTTYAQAMRFSGKYFVRISYFIKIYSHNNNTNNSCLCAHLPAQWPIVKPAQNTHYTFT